MRGVTRLGAQTILKGCCWAELGHQIKRKARGNNYQIALFSTHLKRSSEVSLLCKKSNQVAAFSGVKLNRYMAQRQ